ncbi:MAG: chromate transporter, partial [Firmicutes bacterium]|nr:chromate transporter [Bacillota bacterium]
MKQLLEIFAVFFKIGLFTIGGGYAMLPIIQKEVVETKGWMDDEEFLDALSLTNSLPGPLAINAATFVG